jgi:cation transport ATPase
MKVRFRMTARFATDVPAALHPSGTSVAQRAKPSTLFRYSRGATKTSSTRTRMKKQRETIRHAARSVAPIMAVLLFTNILLAQGPIFTGDASNLSNIIRESLKLMAIILFCLGAVGVAWAIYNKLTGKEWGNQAFGSILSFAFGTIVAVFWQLAQGRAVGVDTNF